MKGKIVLGIILLVLSLILVEGVLGVNEVGIILNYPLNNTYDPTGVMIQFNATCFNYSGSPADATLYGNFNGTWLPNETISWLNGTQFNFTRFSLNDGTYLWNVYCNNTLGNGGFNTTNFTLTVDTTSPIISSESTTPITIYNTNDVSFNATIIDANLGKVWIEGNWTDGFKNYTVTQHYGNVYGYLVASGNFSNQENIAYRWHANDTLSHLTTGNWKSFKVQNRAPSLNILVPIIFKEDNYTTIDLTATDPDGDTLSFTATPPVPDKINVIITDNIMNITSKEENWGGTVTFDLWVRDPYNQISYQQIIVNIVEVNDLPVISAIPTQNILEDSGLNSSLNLTNYTTDVETNSNELMFYVTYDNKSQVNCTINADGDRLDFIPYSNFSGAAYCNITASDGLVNSTEYKINFNVINLNDAPKITSTEVTSVLEDDLYEYLVTAEDVDNDILTFSLISPPENMRINSIGKIYWIPENKDVGNHSITVKVEDQKGGIDTQTFILKVSNVNDLPTIPTLISPENAATIYTNYVTLNWTASVDDDDNPIIYYVYFSNKTDPDFYTITPTTNLTIGNLQHSYTYYWYVIATDLIGNQTKTPTNNFTVSLKNAPVINAFYPLTNPILGEGASQLFNISASDIDPEDVTLNYSWKLNNNVVGNTNSYTFTPNYNQSGTYTLTATVTDSYTLTSTKTWTITVSNTNRAPVLAAIVLAPMNEDTTLTFNINATDDNGDIITYSSNDTKAVVNKLNNNLANVTFTPPKNYFGTYKIKFTVSDGSLTDEKIVPITVNNVNDAPVITDYSPKINPIIKSDGSQKFKINISDIDNEIVPGTNIITTTWKINGNTVETDTGNNPEYTFNPTATGKFNLTVTVVDNGIGNLEAKPISWIITVSNIPITETFSKETTNFSAINLAQATNVVLAKEEGRINFGSESLDLRNVIDLDNNIIIQDKFVGINTNALPQLNKPATIVMKARLNQPIIYYTDEFTTDKTKFTKICNFCTIKSFNKATGELIFDVQHFTTFMAEEKPLKLDISNLEVKVGSKTDKDVRNGDTITSEAKPGNTVRVEATVKNQFEEEMDIEGIIVTGTLVGIDDGEDIEEESDDFDLKQGRSKRITLIFDIPKKIDEDIYDLDLNIEGEDENGTTHIVDWTIYLETKKDNHNIAVDKAELLPNKLDCVRNAKLNLKFVNYGKDKEEEVAYSVFSEELGIDKKEGYFELSEDLFSDDSVLMRTIPIKVSDNFTSGIYPIIVNAFYDKDRLDDTKTVDLIIEDCEVKVKKVEEQVEVKPEIKKEIPAEKEKIEKEIKFTETPEYMALLIGGTVILLVLVIFALVMMMKNRKENY